MKFSTKEDIEASVDQVFAALSDFDAFERSALRRGTEVIRTNKTEHTSAEMGWEAAFKFRGKMRELRAELINLDPPNGYCVVGQSGGMEGVLDFELMPLSRGRTRMAVVLEIKPKTMSARLMIQSLRLARSNLGGRFKTRVANFANTIEDRYKDKTRR